MKGLYIYKSSWAWRKNGKKEITKRTTAAYLWIIREPYKPRYISSLNVSVALTGPPTGLSRHSNLFAEFPWAVHLVTIHKPPYMSSYPYPLYDQTLFQLLRRHNKTLMATQTTWLGCSFHFSFWIPLTSRQDKYILSHREVTARLTWPSNIGSCNSCTVSVRQPSCQRPLWTAWKTKQYQSPLAHLECN